jgi:hypothetical protein
MKKIILAILFMFSIPVFVFAETSVERIAIATHIVDREPSGVSEVFSGDVDKLYCFTEIVTDNYPTKVVHIWLYDNNIIAEVPLEVNSNKWRTYSSKRILPNWQGNWRVEVYDDNGKMIGSKNFTVK